MDGDIQEGFKEGVRRDVASVEKRQQQRFREQQKREARRERDKRRRIARRERDKQARISRRKSDKTRIMQPIDIVNADVDLITRQVIFFFYSFLVVYISKHWYYLMFYRVKIEQSKKQQELIETTNPFVHGLLPPLRQTMSPISLNRDNTNPPRSGGGLFNDIASTGVAGLGQTFAGTGNSGLMANLGKDVSSKLDSLAGSTGNSSKTEEILPEASPEFPNSDKFNYFLHSFNKTFGAVYMEMKFDSQLQPLYILNALLCDITSHSIKTIYPAGRGIIHTICNTLFSGLLGVEVFNKLSDTFQYIIENKKLLFIVLTLIILRFIIKYCSKVYQLFLQYKLGNIGGKSKNKCPDNKETASTMKSSGVLFVIILLHCMMGISLIIDVFKRAIGMNVTLEYITTKAEKQFNDFKAKVAIFGVIFTSIKWLIATALNLLLYKISGFFAISYLYLYSFFGAFIRGNLTNSEFNTIFEELDKGQEPKNTSIFLRLMIKLIHVLYDNLSLFIVIGICIWTITVFNTSLLNKKVTSYLISFNIYTIVIIVSILIIKYTYKNVISNRGSNIFNNIIK